MPKTREIDLRLYYNRKEEQKQTIGLSKNRRGSLHGTGQAKI